MTEKASIKDKIHHELVFADANFPPLDQVACRINMPEHTIRRRLAAENTSSRDILTGVRKRRVLQLIESTNLSMEKIVSLLGYSDTAGFYHAFKMWTGKTPASYRKKLARTILS